MTEESKKFSEDDVITPKYGFWEVTVETLIEDEKGKVKKVKEVSLVDAVNVTDVEVKVTDMMASTMYEWKIVSIKKAKIGFVF